uniref:Uncharacterized protein n=1 Tax=Romanomermis culicivorax TaxID=13658 RepID=A0A915K4W3_ROMCU
MRQLTLADLIDSKLTLLIWGRKKRTGCLLDAVLFVVSPLDAVVLLVGTLSRPSGLLSDVVVKSALELVENHTEVRCKLGDLDIALEGDGEGDRLFGFKYTL